jgi:hypothetical protein
VLVVVHKEDDPIPLALPLLELLDEVLLKEFAWSGQVILFCHEVLPLLLISCTQVFLFVPAGVVSHHHSRIVPVAPTIQCPALSPKAVRVFACLRNIAR